MIKDKVAIVTGASSGIGYATALALSRAGAKVAAGARRMDRLESLQSEIIKNGGEVFIQKLDVTIKSECDVFVDAVMKKWGTIDILVNNAGLQPLSFFKNLKVEEWDKMIDVNIRGVLYCTAASNYAYVEQKVRTHSQYFFCSWKDCLSRRERLLCDKARHYSIQRRS